MRDHSGGIYGLTYRIGRPVTGACSLILDLVRLLSDKARPSSLLLVGRPGSGKTTLLRAVTHLLADVVGRNVIIVDTSNEIGGDSAVAHPCLGRARRLMVKDRRSQHLSLLEAVQNHNPAR